MTPQNILHLLKVQELTVQTSQKEGFLTHGTAIAPIFYKV